jgi:RNA polymerase sigma factor (TIGR02999 family)
MTPHPGVTELLLEWRRGTPGALDQLVRVVYHELKRLAARQLKAERPDHTLQPTALVHEAYTRLVTADVPLNDRAHFFAVAARIMRQVLVDHARGRRRLKRGAGAIRITLDENIAGAGSAPDDILALDSALHRLAQLDARKAEVIQLHFFAGLNQSEIASALGVSNATVTRDLRMARAWLHAELGVQP